MITSEDQKKLQVEGRSVELVQRQWESLQRGAPFLSGITPATIHNKGISQLSLEEEEKALTFFNNQDGALNWIKFIPASGAASRMFSPFFEYWNAKKNPNFALNSYLESEQGRGLKLIYHNLKKLPFYGIVQAQISLEKFPEVSSTEGFFNAFVQTLLFDERLKFSQFPKALIPFFVDETGQELTPFYAQLIEAIEIIDKKGPVYLHFTISKEHRILFKEAEEQFRALQSTAVNEFLKVEYSFQNRLTDTPYLDKKNTWVRNEEGVISFRKGGHGALLENLNLLDADCVWIKNIDNTLIGEKNHSSKRWQQILAGKLLSIQERLFKHLNHLEVHKEKSELEAIESFIKECFDQEYIINAKDKLKFQALYDYLNRPIRVCGMIPNKGEKGGGPFWKTEPRGKSLQIIEGVELDHSIEEHLEAIEESTHFNPVMMVCGITNFKGEKFSLYDFRDEQRFMVSNKKAEDFNIKILEWPGLWNGGMAQWNTVFIELPPDTFHPVKTAADLIQ